MDRMKEDQKEIYYACGRTVEQINLLPQMELFQEKGYEVLYLTHEIDEFAIKVMRDYKEKPYKSIADGNIDLENAEDKEAAGSLGQNGHMVGGEEGHFHAEPGAGAEDLADGGHDGEGQDEAQTHAHAVQSGVHHGVLAGEHLGTAQDDTVNHDQR